VSDNTTWANLPTGAWCVYNNDESLIGTTITLSQGIWLHNYSNSNNFYTNQYSGYVTILDNSSPDSKKAFTNLEFNSLYKDSSGIEAPLSTIDSIQIETSYQDSGIINLTQPTNIRRRFRTWRYQIPKDTDGLRFLDYYAYITLGNTPSNGSTLRLDDITSYYLIPLI